MPLNRRPASLATAAAALVLGLAACGGSSGVSAGAYVKSFCQAVGPFESDVVKRTNTLAVTRSKSVAEGKKAFQSFLSGIAADSRRAASQLRAAGTPNVKNGKAFAQTIVGAFDQLNRTMDQAVKQAASLPTSTPQAFTAAARQVDDTVRSSMTQIGTKLQSGGLRSPALEQAAAKEPACRAFGS
jgi:hypothetical protein